MSANPNAIYDRFDPAKNYDRHLFRADRVRLTASSSTGITLACATVAPDPV